MGREDVLRRLHGVGSRLSNPGLDHPNLPLRPVHCVKVPFDNFDDLILTKVDAGLASEGLRLRAVVERDTWVGLGVFFVVVVLALELEDLLSLLTWQEPPFNSIQF